MSSQAAPSQNSGSQDGAQDATRAVIAPGTQGLLNGYGAVQQTPHSTTTATSGRPDQDAARDELAEGRDEGGGSTSEIQEPRVGFTQESLTMTSGPMQDPFPARQTVESGSSSGRDGFHSAGRNTPQDGVQVAQLVQEQLRPQLFGQEAVQRWAQMERDAPLLYGASGVPNSGAARSDSSGFSAGEIQAEVHRQLELVRREHAAQMRTLAAENEALRARTMLAEGRRPGSMGSQGSGWGDQANKVMEWFGLSAGSFSSFVPRSLSPPGPSLPALQASGTGQVQPCALPQAPGTGQVQPGALLQAPGIGQVQPRALAQAPGTGQVQQPGALAQAPGTGCSSHVHSLRLQAQVRCSSHVHSLRLQAQVRCSGQVHSPRLQAQVRCKQVHSMLQAPARSCQMHFRP